MESCPLCLNDFQEADLKYPLHCPTPLCSFNYCADCIRNLIKSAGDGYQEASDGSRQLKVQVKCPQCREKYDSDSKFPSDVIISSVLCLREAFSLEKLIGESDSDLSASELKNKHDFVRIMSMEQLKDAVRRLQSYQDVIDKNKNPVHPLQWDLWAPHVAEKTPLSASNSANTQAQSVSTRNLRDPTLFAGLHDLMNGDEQLFVTQLMISGKVESLSQAAHILNGILTMASNRAIEQLSFASGNSPSAPMSVDPQQLAKVRKKYALPHRMPRVVQIQDPSKLRLDEQTLAFSHVKGEAGRLGLRKGDIVTHCNGEEVQTLAEFQQQVSWASGDPAWITVNADTETASVLQKRAIRMATEKVRFH